MAKNVGEKVTRGAIGGDRVRPDHDFSPPQVYKVMSRIQETLEPFFAEEKKTEKKGKYIINFSLDPVLAQQIDAGAKFKGITRREFVQDGIKDFLSDWENGEIDDEALMDLWKARDEKEDLMGSLGINRVYYSVPVDKETWEKVDKLRRYLPEILRKEYIYFSGPETWAAVMRMILDRYVMTMRVVFPQFDEECKKIEEEYWKPELLGHAMIARLTPFKIGKISEQIQRTISVRNKISQG